MKNKAMVAVAVVVVLYLVWFMSKPCKCFGPCNCAASAPAGFAPKIPGLDKLKSMF